MFKPIKTKKITDNLYVIRTLIVNMYIYDTGKNLIVFDTGINKFLVKLGFKKLNLDFNKVSHVFLTHSDFDHTGSIKLFKNAKRYLSKEEEPLITRRKARRGIIYNKSIKNIDFLNNTEIINIDNTSIKIISTPGHTIGSAIYIINDDIIIAGDTISLTSKNEINNFSFVQNMNHKLNKETVNTLKVNNVFTNKSIIATGHHGIIRKEMIFHEKRSI